jgi:hypothetical protein
VAVVLSFVVMVGGLIAIMTIQWWWPWGLGN